VKRRRRGLRPFPCPTLTALLDIKVFKLGLRHLGHAQPNVDE
jgi:hypothetical protein